jgi:2-polyprenyl-3-methyl-5-hydroxy-6-metoxy-1,4-benzoquinol methylase
MNKINSNCPLCNGDPKTNKIHSAYFDFLECQDCKFIYLGYDIDTSNLYSNNYYWHQKGRDRINKLLAYEDYKYIEKNIPKGKILDVGCGKGWFLKTMVEKNWDCFGVDLSGPEGKDLEGYNIYFSTDITKKTFDKKFDIITLWDVIEHVNDPNLLLSSIHKILNSNGYLVLETPNSGSVYRKIARKYWVSYNPYHILFFSTKNLQNLLKKNGFQIQEMETKNFNLICMEGLYRLGLPGFLLSILSKYKDKKLNTSTQEDSFFQRFQIKMEILEEIYLRYPKIILNYPLNKIVNNLFFSGDQIRLIARKEN